MKKVLVFLIYSSLCLGSSFSSYVQRRPIISISAAAVGIYSLCYGVNYLYTKTVKPMVKLEQIYKVEKPEKKRVILFVHGLAETAAQASWYTPADNTLPNVVDDDVYSYNFPDVTKRFWRVNFYRTALSQQYEVQALKNAYEQLVQQHPNKKIVLMGLSRGASTIINFVGKYKPKNIEALILESPFDSTKTLVRNMLNKYGLAKVPGLQTMGGCLFSMVFWCHSLNGMQPIDWIDKIDKHISILFIGSMQDSLVPIESTQHLYKKLHQENRNNIYFIKFKNGKHGRILHSLDGVSYAKKVKSFLSYS